MPLARPGQPTIRLLLSCVLGFAAGAVMPLYAQQAPALPAAPPATAAAVPKQDEVITLSPFTVNTSQDVGYVAGNTLAGSRFNTALKDTPAAISVLTTEFLSDLGAFDIAEAMAYAVNAEFDLDDDRNAINGNSTINNYQSFRIRGLASSRGRNYFHSSLPSESAFLERIEDSRGPNSVLFGIGSAGGLINSMTKQADVRQSFQRVSFTLMSYDSKRGTIDINQPALDGKLALRLNAVYNETNTFRHWEYNQHQRVHLAGKYVLNDKTQFRAEFERGQIDSNAPRAENLKDRLLLWVNNGSPTFDTFAARRDLGILQQNTKLNRYTYMGNSDAIVNMRGTMRSNQLYDGQEPLLEPGLTDDSINIGGPGQDRRSEFNILSLFFEHQFNDNLFLEVAYNREDHEFLRYDPQVSSPQGLYGDPNELLITGEPNPYVGQYYLEGGWQRTFSDDKSDTVRAMLSTEYDAGKFGHYRMAGMLEYDDSLSVGVNGREYWIDAETGLPAVHASPHSGQNFTHRRQYVTPGDWKNYYIPGPRTEGLFQNVPDTVSGRLLSSEWVPHGGGALSRSYADLASSMVSLQARYFDHRLVLAAGYRHDSLRQFHKGTFVDPATGKWTLAENDEDATVDPVRTHDVGKTRTLGAVYHLTPKISLFYNQSDNISLPIDGLRLPDSGEPGNPIPLSSPQGETEDFGVALTLLEGRLYARATYYSTGFVNQGTTSPPPPRDANRRIMQALVDEGLITQADYDFRTNVGGRGVFDHVTDGTEFELTANVTKDWRVRLTFAHTETIETNLYREWAKWHDVNVAYLSQFDINNIETEAGRTIAEEIEFYLTTGNGLNDYLRNNGRHKLGNRPYKANVFTRYGFSSGVLRGLYIGGGYTYQSRMFTGIRSQENPEELWSSPIGKLDLMAGYTVRGLSKGRRLGFQLNVLNALDETDPIIKRYYFPTDTERRVRAYSPREGMTWRFTTTFEF